MSENGRSWWQHGIVYQIYPRSFADSNGDGVGDLRGIIDHIDYLEWLGVDAVWVSPIYPSPMADFGYDVSQYKGIHHMFGTLDDFDALVGALHDKGMRLILDFVPNHSSDQHPWFVESKSSRDNPKRDWYIWRDPGPDGGPPNNWLSHFGGVAWEYDRATEQYYLHSFLKEQPDLNWRNPEVRAAMCEVLRFWLERGVDGFRMDVLYQIIKDDDFRDDPDNPNWIPDMGPYNRHLHVYSMDRPEVHDAVAEMRAVLDEFDDTVMIAELWLPMERLVAYYGIDNSGTHLPLNFQLIELQWDANRIRDSIGTYEDLLPIGGWPNWVVGNHDTHRVASRIGPAQARVAAMMLLTLRGTPTMYYGDEIGMVDVPIQPHRVQDPFEKRVPGLGLGRDPERTPMQWSAERNAGFSSGDPWLPIAEEYETINVECQRRDPLSMLTLYRRIIELRRKEEALSIGDYLGLPGSVDVLAWIREWEDTRFLIVLNLGHDMPCFDMGSLSGTIEVSTTLSRADRVSGKVCLMPNEGLIVRLDRADG